MDALTRKQVLVVEDEVALARLVRWQLEGAGFEVQVAHSGDEGLRLAAEHRPDLVLLDVRLPDMTGYEVCRALRAMSHPWTVPVLMLTAMSMPIDRLRGFAHGADAYLTKPYEPNELVRVIQSLLGEMTAV